jgi:hypothetical protein
LSGLHLRGLFPACLGVLVAAGPVLGQKPPKRPPGDPGEDPFTRNDPEKLKRLGYVRLGQFLWLGDVTTTQVQEVLGDDIAIFIETEHFKLASTLRGFPWPGDKEWRASLGAELDALAAVCPELKTRPKTISPWLRAHLYARRLERLYADFCARLGIDPGAFPREKGGARTEAYMGEGPYLGQPGKFLVVLAHKALSAGTYTRALQGAAASDTTRHNHVAEGSLAVVTSSEFAERQLLDDRKLHCHVVFQVVHNLFDGYKFYWQAQPAWLSEGLPLWFSRQVDAEFLNFSGTDDAGSTVLRAHEWPRRVRMRVDNDVWPKAEDLCTLMDARALDFVGHMMVWSRVDFLFSAAPDRIGRFVARMKAPMTAEARLPTPAEVLARQQEALRETLGYDDYAAFDAAWVAFVRKEYAKK